MARSPEFYRQMNVHCDALRGGFARQLAPEALLNAALDYNRRHGRLLSEDLILAIFTTIAKEAGIEPPAS